MYFVIVGGGRVGYYLAKELLDQGHEVVIIEKNAAIVAAILEDLGSIAYRGDGCETYVLGEVGTPRADMLIAVTGDDEDNLVACQVAKHLFQVPRTIARIRDPRNETIFKKLGIDVTINNTNIILENIEEQVPTHKLTHLLELRDQGLEIVEVKIPANASSVGQSVKELQLPPGTVLSLVIRKSRKPIVPSGSTIIQAEDQVVAVTSRESEETLRAVLRDE
jgi:trk system potassium uptake protein TrkA